MKILNLEDYVEYKEGIPCPKKKIEITGQMKGGIKYRSKDKKLHDLTPGGYEYDQCKSGKQKSVRRGDLDTALVLEREGVLSIGKKVNKKKKEVYDIGKMTNMMNRNAIIAFEDIGIANPILIPMICEIYEKFNKLKKKSDKTEKDIKEMRKLCFYAVKMECKSPKSRLTDNTAHAVMACDVENYPKNLKKFEFKNDFKEDNEMLDYFRKCLKEKNAVNACYIAEKIFQHPGTNGYRKYKTAKGKTQKPIYGLWEILKEFVTIPAETWVIESSLKMFDLLKNGGRERLIFIFGIQLICYRDLIEWDIRKDQLKDFKVSDEEYEKILKMKNIKMPDYAIDKHTGEGRKLGIRQFWEIGAKLENRREKLVKIEDELYEMAKELSVEREKEKKKPFKVPGKESKKDKKVKKESKKRKRKSKKEKSDEEDDEEDSGYVPEEEEDEEEKKRRKRRKKE